MAGVVGDGGQFSDYYSGATYSRTGNFTMPSSGLASYQGNYAGLLNSGTAGGNLPAPGGVTGSNVPLTPYRVTGSALVNVDFTNMAVNGGVTNRVAYNASGAVVNVGTLTDIGLKGAVLNADGSFAGAVYIGTTSQGTYSGILGGTNAHDLAAILAFNPNLGPNSYERGVMALGCVATGKGAPCP